MGRRYSERKILSMVRIGRRHGGDIQRVREEFRETYGHTPSHATVTKYLSRYGVRLFNKRI